MQDWKIIFSGPADGPRNMALDEYLFIRHAAGEIPPVFRVYSWDKPCITIGYFQPSAPFRAGGIPVVRRLTGGLSVSHGNDLSYCLVVSRDAWPGIYSQEEMYRVLHQGIRDMLTGLGFPAVFSAPAAAALPQEKAAGSCVSTIYPHDLMMNGRKIAGSCQRRRGKTALVQGSIHIPELLRDRDVTNAALIKGWRSAFNIELRPHELSLADTLYSLEPLMKRYAGKEWNFAK